MSVIGKFTQPDTSPAYFIDFLEFLDNWQSVKDFRAQCNRCIDLTAGNKVLDIGCGIGGATSPIADEIGPGGLVAGIDISTAMIDEAKRRAANRPGIEFRVGDACAIPYPDGFFDSARTERVFLYLPDRGAAIREMKRVVRHGGHLYLIDTDIDSTAIYSTKPALARKMTSIVAASMPNPNSARELPALARDAGLKDIQVKTFALPTPHEFFLRVVPGSISKAAEEGVMPRSEVDEFLSEQASLHANGRFFQIWIFVLVIGRV
jgi:ubiquinone/menaquinone biosynthesis C-methylase UbiE